MSQLAKTPSKESTNSTFKNKQKTIEPTLSREKKNVPTIPEKMNESQKNKVGITNSQQSIPNDKPNKDNNSSNKQSTGTVGKSLSSKSPLKPQNQPNNGQLENEEPWNQYQLNMFGYNQYNQLSTAITSTVIDSLTAVNYNQKYVIDMKLGRFHSLLLTAYGKVIALGRNSEYQRGSLENGEYISTNTNPLNPNEEIFIRKIGCGGMHSVFVDESNKVYTIGDNGEGQCGFPSDVVNVPSLRLVQFPTESSQNKKTIQKIDEENKSISPNDNPDGLDENAIADVFCGENFTFLLGVNKKTLYAMGQNDSGQLGFNQDENLNIYLPRKIEGIFDGCLYDNATILKIESGEAHSLILRSDGVVLVSGSNDDGAIGSPSSSRFTPLTFFKQRQLSIIDIAAGSRHSIFLAQDGSTWVCGKNNYNQLGFHGKQRVEIPVRIMENVQSVHAGSDFTLLRIKEKSDNEKTIIKTTGRNNDGELGGQVGDEVFNTITIDGIARVIACGGYHTMILCGPPIPDQPLYISYPRHLRIVNNLKAKQNNQIVNMQSTIEFKLEEFKVKQSILQKDFETKIEALNIENKTKLDELHQKHHDEKYMIKMEYEEKIRKIKKEIEETTQALEDVKSTHSEDMKENYKTLLSEKEAQKNRLRSNMIEKEKEMNVDFQKALNQENKRHETELDKLQKQYESMEHMLERKLSDQDRQTLTNSYKKHYQSELKEKKKLLDEEYQKQMRKMQRRLDEEYRKNVLWLVTMKKQFELSRMETKSAQQEISKLDESTKNEEILNTRYEERIKRLQKQHKDEIILLKKKAQNILDQNGLSSDYFKDIETTKEPQEEFTTPKRLPIPKLLTSQARSLTDISQSSPRLMTKVILQDKHIGKFVNQKEYTKGNFVEKLHEGTIFNGKLNISLKVMSWSEKEREKMEKQIYRLMQLHHPYIRKCYGLDFSDDNAIVLCEQCDLNIEQYVIDKDLSLKERILLSMQVLEGCSYLFDSRMHANLKPETIFIGKDNSVRIDVIGTAYQHPDIRSVIYSFGFFLYQMATQRTVITIDPETNEVTIPETCPEEISGIILACMHPDETERPTDTKKILDALENARNDILEPVEIDVQIISQDESSELNASNEIITHKFRIDTVSDILTKVKRFSKLEDSSKLMYYSSSENIYKTLSTVTDISLLIEEKPLKIKIVLSE